MPSSNNPAAPSNKVHFPHRGKWSGKVPHNGNNGYLRDVEIFSLSREEVDNLLRTRAFFSVNLGRMDEMPALVQTLPGPVKDRLQVYLCGGCKIYLRGWEALVENRHSQPKGWLVTIKTPEKDSLSDKKGEGVPKLLNGGLDETDHRSTIEMVEMANGDGGIPGVPGH